MSLWPNNRRDILGVMPSYQVTYLAASQGMAPQRQVSFFANDVIEETASIPEGTFQSRSCVLAPWIAGGLSASNDATDITFSGTSDLLNGGPMEGTGSITFSEGTTSLSLTVGLAGTATISFTGDGLVLRLTVGLDGTGTWTLTGDNSVLSLIVPFDGTGSVATLTGTSDLRGLLSLEGEWTPFTTLSPENLAQAVWDALAVDNNDPGTMGEKLNSAGTAGDPWSDSRALTVAKFLGLK